MENYIVINGERMELTEEQMKLLGFKCKRWRAAKGDIFYYVTNFNQIAFMPEDNYNPMCDFAYNSHNYFKSLEDAQKYARVLKTEMLLKKFADEHNYKTIDWNNTDEEKWHLSYRCDTRDVALYLFYRHCDPNVVYFNSKELAQQAVEEIGNDRLVEYFTYEW